MKLKRQKYPGKWRWRFALLPTYFGDDVTLWLEPYQSRTTGPSSWERRDLRGLTVEVMIYP